MRVEGYVQSLVCRWKSEMVSWQNGYVVLSSWLLLLSCVQIIHTNGRTPASPRKKLTEGPLEGKWYLIMSRVCGKALDMYRPHHSNVWNFSYRESQMFRFERQRDGSYLIVVYGALDTVLEFSERAHKDTVRSTTRDLRSHQHWIIKPAHHGGFKIVSATKHLCLEVEKGHAVLLEVCAGNENQTWDIIPLC